MAWKVIHRDMTIHTPKIEKRGLIIWFATCEEKLISVPLYEAIGPLCFSPLFSPILTNQLTGLDYGHAYTMRNNADPPSISTKARTCSSLTLYPLQNNSQPIRTKGSFPELNQRNDLTVRAVWMDGWMASDSFKRYCNVLYKSQVNYSNPTCTHARDEQFGFKKWGCVCNKARIQFLFRVWNKKENRFTNRKRRKHRKLERRSLFLLSNPNR